MVSPGSKHDATLKDLEALPSSLKGEILDGLLYTQPRPRPAHQSAIVAIASDLDGPFQRGRGGPGGWWILPEPGIGKPGSPEFSPDLAGWRRARLPALPDGRIEVTPDWVCEIMSPSTRRYDVTVKRPFYAALGVQFLWYVDLNARTFMASELRASSWVELGSWSDEATVRVAPFDDVELALPAWFAGAPPLSVDD